MTSQDRVTKRPHSPASRSLHARQMADSRFILESIVFPRIWSKTDDEFPQKELWDVEIKSLDGSHLSLTFDRFLSGLEYVDLSTLDVSGPFKVTGRLPLTEIDSRRREKFSDMEELYIEIPEINKWSFRVYLHTESNVSRHWELGTPLSGLCPTGPGSRSRVSRPPTKICGCQCRRSVISGTICILDTHGLARSAYLNNFLMIESNRFASVKTIIPLIASRLSITTAEAELRMRRESRFFFEQIKQFRTTEKLSGLRKSPLWAWFKEQYEMSAGSPDVNMLETGPLTPDSTNSFSGPSSSKDGAKSMPSLSTSKTSGSATKPAATPALASAKLGIRSTGINKPFTIKSWLNGQNLATSSASSALSASLASSTSPSATSLHSVSASTASSSLEITKRTLAFSSSSTKSLFIPLKRPRSPGASKPPTPVQKAAAIDPPAHDTSSPVLEADRGGSKRLRRPGPPPPKLRRLYDDAARRMHIVEALRLRENRVHLWIMEMEKDMRKGQVGAGVSLATGSRTEAVRVQWPSFGTGL
ncbi:hypothetical protein BC937DRAFT_90720, partial [Endogone sp. FLAS-F59071]